MSVTLTFGGMPVPKGWHMWNEKSRPEPGRWFFEARFHHTGHFRLNLDFRPLDGKFPELWMPPLMWKYAAEMEAVGQVLAQPAEKWCKQLLNVHPSNANALKLHMKEYGEKWKKKKKLLFGTSEGAGKFEPDAEISAELTLGDFEWSKEWTKEEIKQALITGLVGAALSAAHKNKNLMHKFGYVTKKPLVWEGKSYGANEMLPGDDDGTTLHALGEEFVTQIDLAAATEGPELFGTDPETGQPTLIFGETGGEYVVPPPMKHGLKLKGKPIPYSLTLFDTNKSAYGNEHRFTVELVGMQLMAVHPQMKPKGTWQITVSMKRMETEIAEFVMEAILPWEGYEKAPFIEVLEIRAKGTDFGAMKSGTHYELDCRCGDVLWTWNFLSDVPAKNVDNAMAVKVHNPKK